MSTDTATGYLVQHDLRTTHQRRVRALALLSSLLLMAIGAGWGLFFALRGAWAAVCVDLLLIAVGALSWGLLRRQRLRAAVLLMSISLLLLVAAIAAVLDPPSPVVPRVSYHFLIPLAVASYLMLKDEGPWLRHAVPLVCLGTLVFFVATGFAVDTPYAVPDEVRRAGSWVNNICAMAALYLLVHVFMGDIARVETYLHGANNRFVGLVRGMFPRSIAERLLARGESFAERHADCSVLFADIVGFTGITERLAPEALVGMLSQIFSRFDACVERAGLTKIKTIGDAYMVAAGVPEPDPRHAQALVALALAMQQQVRDFAGIELRIGIASGELVAGVIGQSRQLFDVWGEVVNLAARTEGQGVPGRVQVSQSCYELARADFDFEPREGVVVRGKTGPQGVYLVRGGAGPAAAEGLA